MKAKWILLLLWIAGSCGRQQPASTVPSIPTSVAFERGEELFNEGARPDSAFFYFTSVTETSKDSLLVAMAYTYMAMIREDVSDYFGCQESALEALRQLNEKNVNHHYCLASVYNELGTSSMGLKNYEEAIDYYDAAIKFQYNESYKLTFLNNKAVTYREMGKYPEAIAILENILPAQSGSKRDYARTLTNLASLRWKADKTYDPLPELRKALTLRQEDNDGRGITASYFHIAEYYRGHRPDSAHWYTQQMYVWAMKTNNADKKLDALRILIDLASPSESKQYFHQYELLNDSLQMARNKARNQYAMIRYRSEKNKEENLALQQENAEKEIQLFRQRVVFYGTMFIVACTIILLLRWQMKKRKAIEIRSQAEIQEAKLATSQKVHDVVANGLYRIMSHLEHSETMDKEKLLDNLEGLYERSRDISYEPTSYGASTEQRIAELLNSFSSGQTVVSVAGSWKGVWERLSPRAGEELEQVLQELMVNMMKHSRARHVVIRFGATETEATISYRDDGIGFPDNLKYGNGLRSTETRINNIGGQFILADEPAKGASIKMVIPIKKA